MQSEISARESQSKGVASRRLSRPTISIVLASSQPRPIFDACVSTLTAHCAGFRAELIVARADSALQLGVLSRLYPQARFVAAPAECSIGELRTWGMKVATGDIVLLVDDAMNVDERFVEGVLGQFRSHDGSSEQRSDRGPSAVNTQAHRESLRVSGES
jgi:hypothetical protein